MGMTRGAREIQAATELARRAAARNGSKRHWSEEEVKDLLDKCFEEVSEVQDAINDYTDHYYEPPNEEEKARIGEEIGDALWSLTMLADRLWLLGGSSVEEEAGNVPVDQRIGDLKVQLEEATRMNKNLLAENVDGLAEVRKLEAALADLNNEFRKVQEENISLRKTAQELREAYESSDTRKEKESLQEKLQWESLECQRLREDNARQAKLVADAGDADVVIGLRNQLEQARKTITTLQDQANQRRSKLVQVKAERDDLKLELEVSHDRAGAWQDEAKERSRQLNEAEERVTRLIGQLGEAEEARDSWRKDSGYWKQQAEEWLRQLNEANERIELSDGPQRKPSGIDREEEALAIKHMLEKTALQARKLGAPVDAANQPRTSPLRHAWGWEDDHNATMDH